MNLSPKKYKKQENINSNCNCTLRFQCESRNSNTRQQRNYKRREVAVKNDTKRNMNLVNADKHRARKREISY